METQQGSEGVQLAAGTVVSSRYEVRALLGIGGFARVYSAFDKVIERDVALKVLDLAALGASEDQIKTLMMRFEREAKLAARIDHPCVVQIHDIGRLDNAQHSPFIVMEMLSGMDLEAYLREHGSLEPGHVWELFTEALEALGEAHKIGIIHRDLKPSNLFLHMPGTRRERLRIVDFGIAAIKIKDGAGSNEDMERLTRTGQLFGTLQYMAPEYIGKQHVSPALDVYQMALILVELLCGERVVSADTPMDCLRLHTFRQMTLPEYLLKSPLRALLKQALEPDPAYRFHDAHAFAEAMHKIDPASIPKRSGTRRLQFLDDQDLQSEQEEDDDEVDGFEDTAVAGGDSLSAAYTMEHGSSPSSASLAAQDSDGDDTSVAPMPIRPDKRPNTGPFNGPTTGAGMDAPDADQTLEERGDEEDAFADTMIAAKPPGLVRDQSPFGAPGGRLAPTPKLGGRTPLLRPGQKSIPSLDDLDGAGSSTAEREPPAELTSPRETNGKLRPLVAPNARVASPGVAPKFEPESGALDDGPTVREMTFPPAADAARSAAGPKPEGASQPAIRLMREPLIETVRQHDTPAQRTTSPAAHATLPPGPSPLALPKTDEVTQPNKASAKPGVNPVVIVIALIVALAVAALAFWAGQQSKGAAEGAGEDASQSAPPAANPAPPVAANPEKTPESAAEKAAEKTPAVAAERRVRIDSIPQGAAILLGTRPLGKTPLDYTFREGQSQLVKVRVQLAGYAEEEVAVDASRAEPIILTLTPAPR